MNNFVQNENITFKFTDDIMPYLLQAKEKFILYNLKEISNFGSFYTIDTEAKRLSVFIFASKILILHL